MTGEFDVRPLLVTSEEMAHFEDEAEYAADQLNTLLFALNEHLSASGVDWPDERRASELGQVVQAWFYEPALVESEPDELHQYAHHLVQQMLEQAANHDNDEGY